MPPVAWTFENGSGVTLLRVADGMVYVGGARMAALDAETGQLRWQYIGGPGATDTPLAYGGRFVMYRKISSTLYPGVLPRRALYRFDPCRKIITSLIAF